jgi:hypothetical protein
MPKLQKIQPSCPKSPQNCCQNLSETLNSVKLNFNSGKIKSSNQTSKEELLNLLTDPTISNFLWSLTLGKPGISLGKFPKNSLYLSISEDKLQSTI